MNHHPISLEQLIAYAAGELPPEGFSPVASHLAICSDCSRTVSNLRAIRSALRTDDSVAPPTTTLSNAYAIFSDGSPRSNAKPKFGWLGATRLTPQLRFSLLLVILGFVLLMDAVVAQAQGAIPGDALYPVKIRVEQIQLGLTPENGKAALQLDLAERRLAEISELDDEGRFQEIPAAADAFVSLVQEATDSLDSANPEAGSGSELFARQVN